MRNIVVGLRILLGVTFLFSAYNKLVGPGFFEITLMDQGLASDRFFAAQLARFFIGLEFALGILILLPILHQKIDDRLPSSFGRLYTTFSLFVEYRRHRKLRLFWRDDIDDASRVNYKKHSPYWNFRISFLENTQGYTLDKASIFINRTYYCKYVATTPIARSQRISFSKIHPV